MKTLSIQDLRNFKPIEGFKVMEWLRGVRDKEYELYTRDPEEYYRQLRAAEEEMMKRAAEQGKVVR